MEFEFLCVCMRWMDEPIIIVLVSLDRTEYYFSLRVQYGKLKTNKGKHSWM
jgi:hypothetical protein